MPKILDGATIAATIKREVTEEVKKLALRGIRPGRATVLVLREHANVSFTHSKCGGSAC
jgi:methylenetetrahydrofolate dehydrogenase (NADP+)/methenyltetrahydrofolate cyclohydrolase